MGLNKLRLKWKVFAFLLGFCSLLLVILWLFQTVFLNDMYKIIRKQELNQAISIVEKEIDNPELQTILFEIQVESDIMVALTRDFIPPYRPGREDFGSRNNMPLETITQVKEFTLQSGQTVSLTFYALVVPVNATVTTLRYQLYYISGIMLILAVGIALIIAKWVSKPIEEISRNALTLAKGDYNTHFDGKGFLEIAALSDTLNTAAVELGRVEALRRELMANVSHDLRTPLSLIYSYAEMMNDFPGEITPEQTRVIMDETRWLTELVNDVLDISKLDNDMERLVATRFNLTHNLRETVARVQELLKNDGFDITFTHSSDVFVNADETKIGRAFYNLLINAVNYSGDSRNIAIIQSISENLVWISIMDSGEGILEDDLPFIWDRYFKSGKKHKRPVIGTGLGLFIVKKIIELHGGKYGVTSEIDKGSTFWFELNIN
ncbi:MAG: two-component sensor histidine kinase [Firmicutes bacterium HGW-Firmicutes-3]|jgi:signal transduction histidine kinase|nr:MAG: two-component sensor histidine kinase [Firmicutes bacterium HGW-Firmicutes-3]